MTENNKKQKKANMDELSESFVMRYGMTEIDSTYRMTLRYWRGDFYLWQEGVYGKLSKDEMRSFMVKHVLMNGCEATIGMMDNLKLNIMARVILGNSRVPDTWIGKDGTEPAGEIVMKNGILKVGADGTAELKPLTPEFFTLGKLPYEYDPSAVCGLWDKVLKENTADDQLRRLLQQWAGYLLLPGQKYQAFMLLIGEAGTGKGTYARAMKAMLGKKNCSDIPLRRFTDKFSLYLTYGKKLNVAGDAEQELTPQAEAVIKTWTGEDGLDFEKKYGEGFTAEPTAKLMILANNFPTFTDKSMGTWRRLKIVPFARADTSVVDRNLDEKLEKELPGILNWALEGLRDLQEHGSFATEGASEEMLEIYRAESNPARMFLEEYCEYEHTYFPGVAAEQVYKAYSGWCRDNGYQKMSSRTFGKEVRRAFPHIIRRRVGGKRDRYYAYGRLRLYNQRNDVKQWLKGR